MKIEINDSKEFELLLDKLLTETVDGVIYYTLYKDIMNSIRSYESVFIESNTFWWLTIHALLDSTLIKLCRVYDTEKKSLSIINLLDTIEANLAIFDVHNFKNRLKDNPFVESLSETARKPNITQLLTEKDLVTDKDPLVKKLIIWRNNLIAHRRASTITKEIDITKDYAITQEEIQTLLDRATSIVNHYSELFHASTSSTQIVGHDDYKYILEAVDEKIQRNSELYR